MREAGRALQEAERTMTISAGPREGNSNTRGGHESSPLAALHALPKEARNLIAGGLAGMTAKTFVAPIDRIKILYQVTSARFRLRDVPRVAYSIIEKEGFAALWKGNTATMIRVFPYSGIQFMVFDYCKVHFLGEGRRIRSHHEALANAGDVADDGGSKLDRHLTNDGTAISHRGTIARQEKISTDASEGGDDRKAGLTPVESLASGMIAGAISVLFTYPLDLARAQLAVLRKQKKPKSSAGGTYKTNLDKQLGVGQTTPTKRGIGYVLSKSVRQGGLGGLYRGITPTMLGILPYSGVAFTINEQAKRQIAHATKREPTTLERLQCGALSGLFAQTLAYPLEVTRRRMQTVGIVPTSGAESAAVNFEGVSRLERSADELPAEARRPGLNVAGSSSSGAAVGESTAQITSNINSGGAARPPSMTTTMRHLLAEQGVRGFYKGVSMNWLKGPVAFSISFTAFDTIQGWIETGGGGGEGEGGEWGADEGRKARARRTEIKRRLTRRLTSDED